MNPTFSIGQIAAFSLPPGWEELYEKKERDVPYTLRRFFPPEHENAILGFFYRGRRISSEVGAKFHSILQLPPHVLTQDEFAELEEVFRDKNDPEEFELVIAKTEEFNGKRVIIIEGTYLGISENVRSMFIDSDGTGTAVQEVYFQANRYIFHGYYKTAATAMRTIKWKQESLV